MMGLVQLKNYIQTQGCVSLRDLVKETKQNPEVLRDMLAHWIRKGVVCKKQRTDACGKSCTQCDPLFIESYEWIKVS